MLHVYAITDSADAGDRAGLQGASTRLVGSSPPFAVVSGHSELPSRLSEDDLWAHESVVEGLMETATVLPMRFGSRVPGDEELEAILDSRRAELDQLLESVRGAVELSVRAKAVSEDGETAREVRNAAAEVRPMGPGTAYLLERAEHDRRGAELIGRVHRPLAELARRTALRPARSGRGAFKCAYLVDRDEVEAFGSRLGDIQEELEDEAQVVCTGPWPPYSFTSEEGI